MNPSTTTNVPFDYYSSAAGQEQLLEYYKTNYPGYYAYYQDYMSKMGPTSASHAASSQLAQASASMSQGTPLMTNAYTNPFSANSTFASPYAGANDTATTSTLSVSDLPSLKVAPTGSAGSHVPVNKAFRQMSHYFDYQSYNEQINRDRILGSSQKPPHFNKKEIQILKKRKNDIKKRKILTWLNKD